MMTLEEMKLAVCEKLPDVLEFCPEVNPCDDYPLGQDSFWVWIEHGAELHWPTEGLRVCHEAEKLLSIQLPPMPHKDSERTRYVGHLDEMCGSKGMVMATHEQRLEALCRVWWPERFNV